MNKNLKDQKRLQEDYESNMSRLATKWSKILDVDGAEPIKSLYKRQVTAVLLENQTNHVKELAEAGAASVSGNLGGPFAGTATTQADIQGYDPILISMVRRTAPMLIAHDICGVQPMTGPTGQVFAMRSHYGNSSATDFTQSAGAEALFNLANTSHGGSSGTVQATHATNTQIDTFLSGLNVTADISANTPDITVAAKGAYTATERQTVVTYLTTNLPWFNAQTLVVETGNIVLRKPAGYATANAEYSGSNVNAGSFREMGFTIQSVAVEATSRQLKAEYTRELTKDLRAIHGLDALKELSNILSGELLAEINREILTTIYTAARVGAQGTTTPGIVNVSGSSNDTDGRWSMERFKGLYLRIEQDLNRISRETRRGKGNIMICSTDVASVLSMTGILDANNRLTDNLNVDETSSTFVGTLNSGRTKVHIDPYISATINFYVVGYKGSSPFDAGIFYCPYVPFEMLTAVGENTFQPKVAFATRYGIVANPLSATTPFASGNALTDHGLTADNNTYYRKVRVLELL